MSVRLSHDEAWDYVSSAVTGVLTTLRRDGFPVALPVWFVVIDREIYLRTPTTSKKARRVEHDGRAAFLVEGGERWTELKAVSMVGRATVVADAELHEMAASLLREKYQSRRVRRESLPSAAVKHYATGEAIIRFAADRLLSWDNARVGQRPG